jgi:multimeric flavodoxin WrbA
MKRILGVMGSPRKNGNTHILVNTILKGAHEAGAEVDILLLTDLKIGECDGCHRCWKGEECPKDDDMLTLYPRIIKSDTIIFGTPVYWYGPTGLMKLFIDRFVYFNCPENRQKIRGKSAVIASPFEDENIETASLLVRTFEKCLEYLEMHLIGEVIVPGVTKKGEVFKMDDRILQAYNLGKRIAHIC